MAPSAAFLKPSKAERQHQQPKKGIHESSHNPLNETRKMGEAAATHPRTADMFLRPTHFLVRPRLSPDVPATFVPMIPVDLLPELLDLAGVPRQLSAAEATGMHNVGTYERPSNPPCYQVRILPVPMAHLGGDLDEMQSISGSSGDSSGDDDDDGSPGGDVSMLQLSSDSDIGIKIKGAAKKKKKKKAAQTQAQTQSLVKAKVKAPVKVAPPLVAERILASASTASAHYLAASKKGKKDKQQHHHQQQQQTAKAEPTSTTSSNSTAVLEQTTVKGNYCRHYCLHGNCRWGNTCRFRHEMPTTIEGLQSVGLRDWPQWFLASMRMVQDGRLAAAAAAAAQMPGPSAMLSPFSLGVGPAAMHHHNPFQTGMGMLGMPTFASLPLQQQAQGQSHKQAKTGGGGEANMLAAERKRRDKDREERQVRRAEERMRELEAERAEGDKVERVRAARAMKLSAAHAAAAKAALGVADDDEEMMLVDV